MSLLETIKRRIGYSGTSRDDEIEMLIEAAQDDIIASGVHRHVVETGSPRIDNCIVSYVLSSVYADMDANIASHYTDAYRRQVSKLALTERCR